MLCGSYRVVAVFTLLRTGTPLSHVILNQKRVGAHQTPCAGHAHRTFLCLVFIMGTQPKEKPSSSLTAADSPKGGFFFLASTRSRVRFPVEYARSQRLAGGGGSSPGGRRWLSDDFGAFYIFLNVHVSVLACLFGTSRKGKGGAGQLVMITQACFGHFCVCGRRCDG